MKLEAPLNANKILLHTCCAPCSSAIVECLLQNRIVPTIFYFNPNIYPIEEYDKRKNECIRYAQMLNIKFVEAKYDHQQWLSNIVGLEEEPERGKRCLKCFELRLRETARYAKEHEYNLIATTLSTSRWKNLEQINQAGKAAIQNLDIEFWGQNWRKDGLQERRNQIVKEQGFYNQTYCGCEFSLDCNKQNINSL